MAGQHKLRGFVYLRISKNIITAVWRTFTDELIAITKRRSTTILDPSPHHKRFFAVNVNGVLAICSLLVGRRIPDS